MVKKISLLLLLFIGINSFCQKTNEEILLTITGPKVTTQVSKEEFKRIFEKNNTNVSDSKKSIDEYLQLFINFKLKVTESLDLGYDTASAFKKEFAGYRDQLAKPYLTSNKAKEDLLKKLYDYTTKDIRISHIMVKLDMSNASPQDTLKAYNKALEIKNRINKGEKYEDVAKLTTEDPSSASTGGDLGWFTTGKFPWIFEETAYSLNEGGISGVVRSPFGYHILKCTGKRPAKGKIKVAHIMKVTPEGMTEKQLDSIKKVIDNVYTKLKQGVSFSDLANEFSDDRRTAAEGGELPMFGTGRMIPEFEDACFALQNNGDFSVPVKTIYGWHIIKRIEKEEVLPFEKIKGELEQRIERTPELTDYIENTFMNGLKKEYNYVTYPKNLVVFSKIIDSAYFLSDENQLKTPKKFSNPVVSFGSMIITQQEFANYLNSQKSRSRWMDQSKNSFIDAMINSYSEERLLKYEDSQLSKKYSAFKYLLEEYHDGILLFNIMDERVWSKAVKDSAGLQKYYNENKGKYKWDQYKLDVTYFRSSSKKMAEKALELYKNKESLKLTDAEVAKKAALEFSGYDTVTIDHSKLSKGDNKYIDSIWTNVFVNTTIAGIDTIYSETSNITSSVKSIDGLFVFIVRNKLIKPGDQKELQDARGLIISDYQDYLEKEWIKALREKYKIVVNNQVLSSLSSTSK